MRSRGMRPFRTEMRIFSEFYRICGSVDMIFVDADGEYRLRDWKRSAKIGDKGFGKAEHPFHRHGTGSYIKYSIQLHVYKTILEREYGILIKDMAIVAFHPAKACFEERPALDLRGEVAEMFAMRRREITAGED